jgi:cytosine deaminase
VIDLRLAHCRRPEGGEPGDLAIAEGRVVEATPETPARATLDVEGRLVTPGLVEAHIHLDKALLAERMGGAAGTLEEAIRLTGQAKRAFTVEDIRARARRVLDLAVAAGTTAMRTHVEVDPIVGLQGIEAIVPLKMEYAPALDLQVCAFAQEGIFQAPGTEELLREALGRGADLVGGCPYQDGDGVKHVEHIFALAREFDVDADFHVDFFDEPDHLHVLEIIRWTTRAGWRGRVTVGHLTELAALPPVAQDEIITQLAAAGIGVICLPATDLYLMGRRDLFNVRRGLAPLRKLLAAGVPVALASNNVRNPFTPTGTADLAHMAFLAALAAHLGTPGERRDLLAMLTTHPARMLRLPAHGLAPGAWADLVVWDCERPEDIAAALPARRFVLKRGRITVEHEHRVVARWRSRG